MGVRGPVPKRESDRLGHAHEALSANPVEKIEFEGELEIPEPDEYWEPIAKRAYQAFLDSPLREFYASTDVIYGWMTAQAINDAMTNPTAARTLAADEMMKNALFNEAARRRIRVEITRKEPEKNPVVEDNVAQFRKRRLG